jgi:hypothetical protein
MNADQYQLLLQAVHEQNEQLKHQNKMLQQQQAELTQKLARTARLELRADILEAIPPHLQLKPMEAGERKALLGKYPKAEKGLPKPLRDDNGLGAKAVQDTHERKFLFINIPLFQKEGLDILRVSAVSWDQAATAAEAGDLQQSVNILFGAVRDITVLAADNAQRLADMQIKGVFDAAGVKGAHSFVRNGGGEDADIDLDDTNVVQQAHVEAMSDLWKMASHLRPARNAKDQKRNDGFRGHGRGGGGKGGGGKGGGRWSSYRRNNYSNHKGKGNGSTPAQAKPE